MRSGIGSSVLASMKSGLNGTRMRLPLRGADVSGMVAKARGYARSNPSKVLAGLAIAVIGAGLLARNRRGTVKP